MPGNSNTHDDESDHESLNELLSPSDGYFAEGHMHPGEVLVPDPSQGPSQLDKEHEARDALQASTSSSSPTPPRINTSTQPTLNTQSPPRSNIAVPASSDVNERTPLIASAPPAYSPPEPGSPYHQHTRSTSTAGIHETMGRPDPFFPNSTEDLGGDGESLLPNGSKEKRWSSRLRNWWEVNSYEVFKYIMLAFTLVLVVLFLIQIIKGFSEGANDGTDDHEHIDLPVHDGIPSSCKIHGSGSVGFTWEKPTDFALIHFPKPGSTEPRQIEIQNLGKIHIRSLPKDVKDAVKVDLEYYWSSTAVISDFEFTKEDRIMRIFSGSTVPDRSNYGISQPCLYLNITIWLNAALAPEDFYISTTTLDVIFEKGHTAFGRDVTVGTLTGSVKSVANDDGSVSWGGREVTIITDTGSIDGAYPLYDKLHLETRAGSIDTQLTLHPGQYGRESEALLILKTNAGSIRAKTPILRAVEEGIGNYTIEDIPKRDYRTEVSLHSGSTDLQLAHGSRTWISSDAGSVHAELTPWLEPRKESLIIVNSKTGGIDMTVRDAIAYKDQPLRNLYGEYYFPTGYLTLRYPAEWEGDLVSKLVTGSTSIDWPGMDIRRHGRTGVYYQLEASKGKGSGYIHSVGGSGSVTLLGKGGKQYPKTLGKASDEG